jgi:hypothetical protein
MVSVLEKIKTGKIIPCQSEENKCVKFRVQLWRTQFGVWCLNFRSSGSLPLNFSFNLAKK